VDECKPLVAGVPLAALNGWGERSIGLVQSSFLWGYMLTPLLGGVLADRYGGKAVLGRGLHSSTSQLNLTGV